MNNGHNDWDVPFSHIAWLDRLLKQHANTNTVSRGNDILFEVVRKKQEDRLMVLCLKEYTMGFSMVQRARKEFGDLDIIYIGGGWNGYQPEAKEYCLDSKTGLYVSDEMSGALWRDEYWSYQKKDKDGNPILFERAP